jgi:hypothetical protein
LSLHEEQQQTLMAGTKRLAIFKEI